MKNLLVFFLIVFTSISYSQGLLVKYSHLTTYPDHPEDNSEIEWNLYLNNNTSLYEPVSLYEEKTTIEDKIIDGVEGQVIDHQHVHWEIPYKIYETKEQITIQHFYRKDYLIKEPLQTFDWTITDQTKNIGKYTVRLAKTTRLGYPVDAWFTEEIPFSSGPAGFHGLPGLILEYSLGFTQIVVKTIDFSYNKPVPVPDKGIAITREDFKTLEREMTPLVGRTTETENTGNMTTTTIKEVTKQVREAKKKN